MVFIYILELENKKYYVGKTTNPKFRLQQHFNSNGSEWTKKYKPKNVLELIPNCNDFDENKYTLQYMSKYGINHVRGGSFCNLKLDKTNLSFIKKMIDSSTDKCYICGEKGHFANKCKEDNDKLLEELEKILINNDLCFRCYRSGHYETECYAKTKLTGSDIEDTSDEEDEEDNVYCCSYCNKEFDTLRGATFHENVHCKNKYNKTNKTKIVDKNSCYRCGRKGHYSDDCYASTHVNGRYLD
jgi:hypothetical protein